MMPRHHLTNYMWCHKSCSEKSFSCEHDGSLLASNSAHTFIPHSEARTFKESEEIKWWSKWRHVGYTLWFEVSVGLVCTFSCLCSPQLVRGDHTWQASAFADPALLSAQVSGVRAASFILGPLCVQTATGFCWVIVSSNKGASSL